MKITRIALVAVLLLGALPVTGSAATSIAAGLHIGPSGRTSVDIGFFYDDLAAYGHWIQRPRYGWVWTPRVAVRTWRPYEYGHWVWTDLGWTWVSDEPFGWATYHYGRWYDDPDYGWEWVPGNQWAPAWVDWQASDDYVGWAPLPPGFGYRPGVTLSVALAPEDFVFVPAGRFLDTRLVNYAVPSWQCAQIYPRTRSFTRFQNFNNQVFNAGFPVDRVQRWTGRQVQRFQVADLGWNQRHQTQLAQNRVALFRPQVQNARVAPPVDRPIARRAVLAGAAATAAIAAHHAFRATQANHQPQAVSRQQQLAQRQAQVQGQALTRQQLRVQGRQQRQQAQLQAHLQRQQGRGQRQAQMLQQQQNRQLQRSQRQAQMLQQQQSRQQQRLQRQQQQARSGRQQMRFQRQQQQQAQQQARQQQRFQRQQQQQAQQQNRQQMRFQRQQQQQMHQQQQQQARAQRQQQRPPQRQWQQAQAQRQQPRPQRQGNPGQQGQGNNHHRQRPPQQQ